MNKVMLIGRLTKDPDFHEGENPYCRYTLAVNRIKKDEADFISCVAFGKSAEFARDNFHKGIKIAIVGHIQTGKYEGKNGTVYTTDVIIENQECCESKKEPDEGGFVPVIPENADEELPFR